MIRDTISTLNIDDSIPVVRSYEHLINALNYEYFKYVFIDGEIVIPDNSSITVNGNKTIYEGSILAEGDFSISATSACNLILRTDLQISNSASTNVQLNNVNLYVRSINSNYNVSASTGMSAIYSDDESKFFNVSFQDYEYEFLKNTYLSNGEFENHITDYANPHKVTGAQVRKQTSFKPRADFGTVSWQNNQIYHYTLPLSGASINDSVICNIGNTSLFNMIKTNKTMLSMNGYITSANYVNVLCRVDFAHNLSASDIIKITVI